MKLAMDAIVMMCPWFFSIMLGMNSRTIRKCEMVFTSNVWRILDSDFSSIAPSWPTPALLIRMVGCPLSARIVAATSAMLDEEVMSVL